MGRRFSGRRDDIGEGLRGTGKGRCIGETARVGVLKRFCEFAADFQYADLPEDDRAILGIHLLDTVGASIAGAVSPDGRALSRLVSSGALEQTAPGPISGDTLDMLALQTATTRLTEIDDIHLASNTTPGAVVIPTALILATRLGSIPPEDLAASICVGYEAITRLGLAINGPEVLHKGVWPTYFCAPFAAAAVTARLLRLTPTQSANALAIALTLCNGRAARPAPGLTARWLVVGEAVRGGCRAAIAAAEGFTGDAMLLDGDWLDSAHGIASDGGKLAAGLNGPSVLGRLSLKPYCAAKQTIAALSGFMSILAQGIDEEKIAEVEVAVPKRYAAMIDHGVVAGNRLSSISSVQHTLALAACRPGALDDISRADMPDERVAGFMEKVRVAVDDGLADHLPDAWPARVSVTTSGGTASELVIDAPGDPAKRLDLHAAKAKFHRFVDPAIGGAAADEWAAQATASLGDGEALAALLRRYAAIFAG